MKKLILNFNMIFSAGLTVAFSYGVYESLSYAYLAQVFPLSISIIMLIAAIVNLVREFREIRTPSNAPAEKAINSADLQSDWEIPMSDVWAKLLVYLVGILVIYLFVWIMGYPLSMTLFILLFYRYVAETGWFSAFIAAAAGLGFLALVSKLLNMDWPEGLLLLPWPLG